MLKQYLFRCKLVRVFPEKYSRQPLPTLLQVYLCGYFGALDHPCNPSTAYLPRPFHFLWPTRGSILSPQGHLSTDHGFQTTLKCQ